MTANGIPAPILYASPSQINIQLPFEVSGAVILQVTTPNGSTTTKINVAATAPSILAVVSGVRLNSSDNPAEQGSYVTAYLTGLGAPTAGIATGQPAPNAPAPTATAVQVTINDITFAPAYAGLAPGFAGLDQLNFQVPAKLADGVYSLRVAAGGATSNPVQINIGPIPLHSSIRGAFGGSAERLSPSLLQEILLSRAA